MLTFWMVARCVRRGAVDTAKGVLVDDGQQTAVGDSPPQGHRGEVEEMATRVVHHSDQQLQFFPRMHRHLQHTSFSGYHPAVSE